MARSPGPRPPTRPQEPRNTSYARPTRSRVACCPALRMLQQQGVRCRNTHRSRCTRFNNEVCVHRGLLLYCCWVLYSLYIACACASVMDEINKVRTNPASYIRVLKRRMQFLRDDGCFYLPHHASPLAVMMLGSRAEEVYT